MVTLTRIEVDRLYEEIGYNEIGRVFYQEAALQPPETLGAVANLMIHFKDSHVAGYPESPGSELLDQRIKWVLEGFQGAMLNSVGGQRYESSE